MMRSLMIIVIISIFLPVLLSLNCPTIDPPLPKRLSAPHFTGYEIIAKADYELKYNETIELSWEPDSTDSISVSAFNIIRYTPYDSSLATHSIPADIRNFNDPVFPFNFSRSCEQQIYYRIYAIDSLERAGDTSVACTVSLAPEVTLMHPGNIINKSSLSDFYFKWEVSQIVNETVSHAILWKNDTTFWESDSAQLYTGGTTEIVVKSLPDSIIPLPIGKYYWGVELVIIGGKYPTSITIRDFYVE